MMERKQHKLSDFFLLYGGFLIYSVSSVFAKEAGIQKTAMRTLVFFALEFLFLGIYAIIWQQALKRFPLTIAISNKGITILFSLIWSVLIFKEGITLMNIIGTVLVIAGVVVVSSDG